MILKSEIEQAYLLQQDNLHHSGTYTNRSYLQKMAISKSHIEVISGIRRCGKSTLLKQLMVTYPDNAYFNFEDSRINGFEIGDFQKLDEVIGKNKSAYFFDEIQNIPSWEIFVRNLHDRGEKVFITGSNASLLSKELGTRLTGRHIRHELFPFSYSEFRLHKKLDNNVEALENYIRMGGFPEYLEDENPELLQTLLKDIVMRDIAVRYGVKNTKALIDITLYLISNIGKEFTYNSIRKTFSIGSANSVSDYLSWLEDSYVFFFLPRFSWSAKKSSVNPRKVYAIDNGMVNANSLSFSKDKGRLLENAIYLFLRQTYSSIFYFREKGECDFVVFRDAKPFMLIQVCEEVHNENKDREIKGLIEAMAYFKFSEGLIVTKDQKDSLSLDKYNIRIIPAYQFMTADSEFKLT